LVSAWDDFFHGLDELDDIETVRYDAVDITRQMLETLHRNLYVSLLEVKLQCLFLNLAFSSKGVAGREPRPPNQNVVSDF